MGGRITARQHRSAVQHSSAAEAQQHRDKHHETEALLGPPLLQIDLARLNRHAGMNQIFLRMQLQLSRRKKYVMGTTVARILIPVGPWCGAPQSLATPYALLPQGLTHHPPGNSRKGRLENHTSLMKTFRTWKELHSTNLRTLRKRNLNSFHFFLFRKNEKSAA